MTTGAELNARMALESIARGDNNAESVKKSGGKEGGLFAAMAAALGNKLDDMARDLTSFANGLPKDMSPSQTTQLQLKTQMFSITMQAADGAIKAVGEGLKKTASKD